MRLGGISAGSRSRFRHFSGLEIVDDLLHVFRFQVLVIFVVNLNHGRVDAGAETFYFVQSEHAVFRRFSFLDAQFLLKNLHDAIRIAEPAWSGAAKLHVEFSNRIAIKHGVEGRDFVDANARHIQHIGTPLHSAQWQPPSVLSLSQVKNGNERGLFMPFRIIGLDGFNSLEILLGEFEGNIGVVLRRVPVNEEFVRSERS